MTSKFPRLAIAAFALGMFGAAGAWTSSADARSRYYEDPWGDWGGGGYQDSAPRRDSYRESHYDGHLDGKTPALAVVAIRQQRVTIYDANGKIMESGISSGQNGLETPPGIYSVVQKEEDHHSNIYDDASMPFMERITWTGISLHAGVLPGYPASHGCVRLPERFADDLYQVSKLGMRVVIVRDDILPAAIEQPAMFNSAGGAPAGDQGSRLKLLASTKAGEAEATGRRLKDAKAAAQKKSAETAAAERAMHAAETALEQAQAGLKAAEQAASNPTTPERQAAADAAKTQAQAKVDAAKAKLDAAKAEAQAKGEVSAKAEAELREAAAANAAAQDAAEQARLDQSPVSVFISRKTQRLYIRKNNIPVYESPVLIRDADKAIGTFVFTALDYGGSGGAMRWNVVSMYQNATNIEPIETAAKGTKGKVSTAQALPADIAGARAALARLTIPEEALERISAVVLPASSLIISDEGLSNETGKDTDFIVVMSGEPQGSLAMRHHPQHKDEWGDSFFGGFSGHRRGGGGGFLFYGD